jgi:DtxR family Mn-dependent transcriptional regulator
MTNHDATETMQRYAAEIYRLQQDHEKVALADLTEHVDKSAQAVSKMLQKMKDLGYLEHLPYRGVHLTPSGEAIAMPALRRHRLAEVFLVQKLGYDWAAAHELTDTFELGLNDELEDRIDEITGHPTNCPHGEPIPSKDGVIKYPEDRNLTELGTEHLCRISRVRTHNMDKLRYLATLNLVPGTMITITGCAPFQGPLRIKVQEEGRTIPIDQVIGYELAKVLWVDQVQYLGDGKS